MDWPSFGILRPKGKACSTLSDKEQDMYNTLRQREWCFYPTARSIALLLNNCVASCNPGPSKLHLQYKTIHIAPTSDPEDSKSHLEIQKTSGCTSLERVTLPRLDPNLQPESFDHTKFKWSGELVSKQPSLYRNTFIIHYLI